MIKHFKYKSYDGYCGIANLANTFREESFLDYLENPKFIPCGCREMSKILQECGYAGSFIVPFIQLPDGMKVQNSLVQEIIMSDLMNPDEDSYMPFILNLKMKESDPHTHSVSVLKFSDHLLYSDPNNNEYVRLDSIDQLFGLYYYCSGIWGIERDFEDGNTMVCNLKLRHLFYD